MHCKLDILILVQFVASACQVELVFCVGTHYVPGHGIRSYKLAGRSITFTKSSCGNYQLPDYILEKAASKLLFTKLAARSSSVVGCYFFLFSFNLAKFYAGFRRAKRGENT